MSKARRKTIDDVVKDTAFHEHTISAVRWTNKGEIVVSDVLCLTIQDIVDALGVSYRTGQRLFDAAVQEGCTSYQAVEWSNTEQTTARKVGHLLVNKSDVGAIHKNLSTSPITEQVEDITFIPASLVTSYLRENGLTALDREGIASLPRITVGGIRYIPKRYLAKIAQSPIRGKIRIETVSGLGERVFDFYRHQGRHVELFFESGKLVDYSTILDEFTPADLKGKQRNEYQKILWHHLNKTTLRSYVVDENGERIKEGKRGARGKMYVPEEIANNARMYLVDKGYSDVHASDAPEHVVFYNGVSIEINQFYREMYSEMYEKLIKYAKKIVPNNQAEDIVQHTLGVKLPRELEKQRMQGTITTFGINPWLYTVVRNLALNEKRDYQRRKAMLDQEEVIPVREYYGYHKDGENIVEGLIDREGREMLYTQTWGLTDDHREILTLRYVEDLDYDEIGKRINVPKGTVCSRISRAKESFLKILKANEEAFSSICEHYGLKASNL